MKPQRLSPSPTAFRATNTKQPREHNNNHLAFIRQLPCLVTGRTDGVEAAHIRYGNAVYGKRTAGKGEKPSDCWAVPLHTEQHRDQHQHNEKAWWQSIGIDPLQVSLALHLISGDLELGRSIIREAQMRRGNNKTSTGE